MKLALVFCIIGGLISCSLQQGRLFRAGWIPNNFQQARLPYYYFADQDADVAELDHQLYEFPSNDVQKNLSPFFKSGSNKNNNPQSRFYGLLLFNQLKNSLLSSLPTVTFTSTSTSVSTSVSTITTLALQNCISSSYFSTDANNKLPITAPCSKKKRSIELGAIEPSETIPMETSRIARDYDEKRNSDPYALSSSFSDLQEESDDLATSRQIGFSNAFPNVPKSTLVVTTTSTTTSFSFVASTVKKPFSLAPTSALTCLPPGFVVC